MSYKKILVTGGAGFIGSHLVDELIKKKYQVTVMDNLEPQVHGKNCQSPQYLNAKAKFIKADINNKKILALILKDTEIIFHLCALVGVGQSMYDIKRYVKTNTYGTASLLQAIVNTKNKIKKIIVASSMSIYGEGAYLCKSCGIVYPKERKISDLKNKFWEMKCEKCTGQVKPITTNEEKFLNPTSIYAITKKDQEEMCLSIGKAYKIPTVALRFFNVYGERQSLSNPYTGVAAIFSARILNSHSPIIFEDGLQSRDFVYVKDIVQANILAMEKESANYQTFNVGSGQVTTILEVAQILMKKLKFKGKEKITNNFREGDIRHCFADISKIKITLGYKPKFTFAEGITRLIKWNKNQTSEDKFYIALKELQQKGLVD